MEPDQECLVGGPVRVVVGEIHAERASGSVAPLRLGHFGIVATEPRDVLTSSRLPLRVEQELSLTEILRV